MENPLTF